MARTQDAVARLAADAREGIEKDWKATAGAIATVEERTTIAQIKTQRDLEKTRWFQQHQQVQTWNAINHFVVAQLPAIIEKMLLKQQKHQEQVAAESTQQLEQAPEILGPVPQYPVNQY